MAKKTAKPPRDTFEALKQVREKFAAARAELNRAMVERGQEIDLVLTGLLCRQHVLLVGPPGAGKSLLLNGLMSWMGGSTFNWLMNRFTTPDELFGPISFSGLKADKYVRVTKGKLPEAEFAYLDEIWKGSSAIHTTLLKLLNERRFDRGDQEVSVPLRLCVASSNEWPQAQEGSQELHAAFDRFLFRKTVKLVATETGMERLLWADTVELTPNMQGIQLSSQELDFAIREAEQLPVPASVREVFHEFIREAEKAGVRPGDRRRRQAVSAVKAFAFLNGADEVEPDHLEILEHVWWDDPTEQPTTVSMLLAKLVQPVGSTVSRILSDVEETMRPLRQKPALDEMMAGQRKLKDMAKELEQFGDRGGGRAKQALAYLQEQMLNIKKTAMDLDT